MYREYEKSLLKAWAGNDNVKLFEFTRDKWTFHAKGCWIYENGQNPNISIIGSK